MSLKVWNGSFWVDVNKTAIPTGGTKDQIATKKSLTDLDLEWTDAPSAATYSDTAPGSPTAGQLWVDSDATPAPTLNVYNGTSWDRVRKST